MAVLASAPGETGTQPGHDLALAAYESLAPFYDRFTEGYVYDEWLASIETWALAHGLRGKRLLDVACGTGKSFAPMLARGYEVTACDLSPQMVDCAQRRARDRAEVVVADMRALPWRSQFDLITCMDDAINYLLTPDDLALALGSISAALAPGGICVFDTNSLATYRTTFASEFTVLSEPWQFRWRGRETPDFDPQGIATATVDVTGSARIFESRHVQRHWPVPVVRSACLEAGLERISFRGQLSGGVLGGDPDETRHNKIVCLAARSAL
jgi:SAM-dependent methyltransferase